MLGREYVLKPELHHAGTPWCPRLREHPLKLGARSGLRVGYCDFYLVVQWPPLELVPHSRSRRRLSR
jgi:hypothetical protein